MTMDGSKRPKTIKTTRNGRLTRLQDGRHPLCRVVIRLIGRKRYQEVNLGKAHGYGKMASGSKDPKDKDKDKDTSRSGPTRQFGANAEFGSLPGGTEKMPFDPVTAKANGMSGFDSRTVRHSLRVLVDLYRTDLDRNL